VQGNRGELFAAQVARANAALNGEDMVSAATAMLALAVGTIAFSLQPALSPTRSHVCAASRSIVPVCAYNPQPSKARPKKQKIKEPKEKVKGPPSAAAAQQLVPEQTFWEGPPSITETVIPGISLFTVIGAIPFSASLARQAWTRYKITNKRLEVKSGFQGKDVVQITWREIVEVKWLRRFGGVAGDLVLTLKDGVKLEMRSLPEFDRNLKFIMDQCAEGVDFDSGYPDGPAKEYMAKVESGEESAPVLPPYEAAAAPSV